MEIWIGLAFYRTKCTYNEVKYTICVQEWRIKACYNNKSGNPILRIDWHDASNLIIVYCNKLISAGYFCNTFVYFISIKHSIEHLIAFICPYWKGFFLFYKFSYLSNVDGLHMVDFYQEKKINFSPITF